MSSLFRNRRRPSPSCPTCLRPPHGGQRCPENADAGTSGASTASGPAAATAPAPDVLETSKQRPGDQPLPVEGRECVQDALIAHIEERKRLGIERYGRPLETHNGRDAVQDALEEALDLAVYLMQVRLEQRDLRADLARAQANALALDQAATRNGELYAATENQRDDARDKLTEARSWARHGYEIGQRHCGWTDHGVAPRWLTEGWPPQIDTCQHLTELAIAEARIAALRALAESWEREHPRFGIGAQVLAALDGPPDTSAVIPLPQPTTEEPYWRRPHTSPTPEATP